MKFTVIIALILSGCASNPSVTMQWKIQKGVPLKYRATINAIQNVDNLDLNVEELISKPKLVKSAIRKLKKIHLKPNYLPLLLTVTNQKEKFNMRLENAKLEFSSPALSAEDKEIRQALEKIVGMVQVISDFDKHGKILSFYLKQNQKTIVSQWFSLPKTPVRVGDTWSIPIYLINISSNYVVDNSERINKVTLHSLRHTPEDGLIAEFVYLISDKVAGTVDLTPNKKLGNPKFSFNSSYVAYGEYLVDKGYWKKYIGQHTAVASGYQEFNFKNFYALKLIE